MAKASTFLVVFVSIFLYSGCQKNNEVLSAQSIKISEAFLFTTPIGQTNTALYVDILNNTQKTYHSISATSSISPKIELHSTTLSNGKVSMQHMTDIELLPGKTLSLKPGGDHFMVMKLQRTIREGEVISFTICLDNDCQTVEAMAKHPMRVNDESHRHHH